MTTFAESEALLALLRDDEEEAATWLSQMLPGELARLASTCGLLAQMARSTQRRKRATPTPEDVRGVACPRCTAKVGEPCHTLDVTVGWPRERSNHPQRVNAFRVCRDWQGARRDV